MTPQYVIRMIHDTALCHPNEIAMLMLKSSGWLSYRQYLIRMTYGHCRMSSGWLTILPYLIRMTYCYLNPKSSGWVSSLSYLIWTTWGNCIRMTYEYVSCHPEVCWSLSHPDDLAIGSISSGLLVANVLCHPDGIRSFPESSGWQNAFWTLSHPDELAIGSMSSGWLMDTAVCQPDDLRYYSMSSGWDN